MKEMTKRVLSVIVLFALTAICFFLSRATAVLILCVSGLLCCNEMSNALGHLGFKTMKELCSIMLIAAAFMMYFRSKLPTVWFLAALIFFAAGAFVTAMVSKKYSAVDVMMTLAMIIYPLMPFVAILYIATIGEYRKYTWLAIFFTGFFSAILCDTFALFGGRLCGKHRLSPN